MDDKSIERRKRIRLALFAFAYEFENTSLVSDATYDSLSREIDVKKSTGNRKLDKFFRDKFIPDSGMWVRDHPELGKLRKLYDRVSPIYNGR